MSHSDSGTSRGGKAYSGNYNNTTSSRHYCLSPFALCYQILSLTPGDSSPVHEPQYPLVRSPHYHTGRNPYATAVPWAPVDSSTLSTSQSCENQSFTSHDDSISSAFTAERGSSGLVSDLRAYGAQGSQRTANQLSHLCEHCGKRLSSKTALTRHIRNSHTPDVPMSSCPVPGCEYKTKRSDSLSRHVEKCRSKRERSLAAGVLSHTATARWNNEKPWSDLQVLTEAAHFQGSATVGALDCMMAQGSVPYTTSRQDAERALKSAVSQRNKAQRHKSQLDRFWHDYPDMDHSSTYHMLAQLDMELEQAVGEIARWRNILYVAEGRGSGALVLPARGLG